MTSKADTGTMASQVAEFADLLKRLNSDEIEWVLAQGHLAQAGLPNCLDGSTPLPSPPLLMERQSATFQAYKVAFNTNTINPCLKSATALVEAWTAFANAMGVDLK